MQRSVLTLVALGVAACGSRGGGGGGAAASLTAPVATPTSSSTTAPVPSTTFPPLVVPAASQAELDQVFADTWTALMPTVRGALDAEIQKLVGTMVGPVKIDSLSLASLDMASPPRIAISNLTSGTQVQISFPRGTWAIGLAGHVEYSVSILTLSADVTANLTNVQATETVVLDTSDPTLPVVAQAGKIQTSYDLAFATTNTALAALLPSLQPMLKTYVDQAIQGALAPYDAIFASLVGQPNAQAIWGLGAPARPAFGLQPNLENAALAVSQDIQTVNTPYGGIVTAYMSDPTPGLGTPLRWEGYGDSAIWTGHYLAAEAFRYAVTKDPAAQANASLALAAIRDMLDAETPGGGHLCRCVVPATAPDAATLLQQANAFTSTVRGQSVVCLGDVTRDQYLGVMHGLGCAYDLLDDPATKQLAGSLVERIVDYLVANGWIAMKHDNTTASALFCVSPEKMVAFTALAAHVDAAKYQALRDQVGELAWAVWVFDVPGTIDPLESYYKWNLEEGAIYHALRLETDPGRQAALMAAHAIDRRVIGHHENAYFQTIDAALDPALAASLGPMILDELRRFAARGGMNGLDRRDFTVTNSTDPTIAQGTYTSLIGTSTTTLGQGATTSTEALYPIAVEKRPCTDFLWQRDPFTLDGAGDPQRQAPGVDLVLPYWMARFHGLIP